MQWARMLVILLIGLLGCAQAPQIGNSYGEAPVTKAEEAPEFRLIRKVSMGSTFGDWHYFRRYDGACVLLAGQNLGVGQSAWGGISVVPDDWCKAR